MGWVGLGEFFSKEIIITTLVGKTSEKHLCRQRIIIMTLLVGKSRGLLDPAVATAKATAALAELDLRSKIARGGKNFPNFFLLLLWFLGFHSNMIPLNYNREALYVTTDHTSGKYLASLIGLDIFN